MPLNGLRHRWVLSSAALSMALATFLSSAVLAAGRDKAVHVRGTLKALNERTEGRFNTQPEKELTFNAGKKVAIVLAMQIATAGTSIGVAAWVGDEEVCLAMPGPALAPGAMVTLVQPIPQQSTLVATIAGSTSSCERLERALIPGPYYRAHATRNAGDSGTVWIAFPGRLGTRRGDSGAIAVRLGSPYPNAQVRSCPSREGLHLTVWAGTPLTSQRLWHQYYYLGYDVDPSCDDRETR